MLLVLFSTLAKKLLFAGEAVKAEIIQLPNLLSIAGFSMSSLKGALLNNTQNKAQEIIQKESENK